MKYINTYILFFITILSKSQNLVPNYSFETYTLCPNTGGQIEVAIPWNAATSSTSSTDYFNSCSFNYSVPYSGVSFQYAHTGNAYAGLGFCAGTGFREYLQVQLTTPLIQSQTYYVEFYVNSASASWNSACNNIAANLSVIRPLTTNTYELQSLSPHIINPGNPVISDTLNWIKVSGCYTAQGGEEYITIGNFFDNANTQVIGTTTTAYYLIDDVLVEEMTGPCVTGINDIRLDNIVSLLPNPANGLLSVNSTYEIDKIELSNIAGQLLLSEQVHSKTHRLQVGNLAEGIYFMKIIYLNGLSVTKKVVKQ